MYQLPSVLKSPFLKLKSNLAFLLNSYSISILENTIYPYLTWRHKESTTKNIYLTFDDGPIPKVTEFVIDNLKIYNAKATFFCVGENIKQYPHILQMLIDNGHCIGNHTSKHLNGWCTPCSIYLDDIERCSNLICNTHKVYQKKKLFRPPYGKITFQQIKELLSHYEIIMWNVLTKDYAVNLSSEKCFKRSIQYTRYGSIVVFHDSVKAMKNLYYVLPRFLNHFASKGFNFKTF